jgi:predicted TIM-barrel fold metal-dependent hydrolase
MDYGAWDEIFNFIATDTKPGIWAGAKMYPPLGHKPLDELCEYLPDFYHRCEKDKIPILTHCSPGGMTTHEAGHYMAFDIENGELCRKRQIARQKQREKITRLTGKPASNALGYTKEWGEATDKFRRFPFDYFFKNYVHPEAWRPVLENFPDLHLCLAHFGGDEWRRGPISEWTNSAPSEWIKSIIDLTKKYKNVYTDISCFNLEDELVEDNGEGKKVRNTLNKMLHWMRDRDEYKHLRNKVIFGTDWYLTHLTRSDEGAEYGHYCRDFKKLIDQVDSTFWIRFTLVNPWLCYTMSKSKLKNMKEALCDAGVDKPKTQKNLDLLLTLDDEVSRIKEQLARWDA